MTNYYDDLEARLTDPAHQVASAGAPKTGADAAAEGHSLLLSAYGSMETVERAMATRSTACWSTTNL